MSKKILLADDSSTIQRVVSIIFADLDYEVLSYSNGVDALEAALAERPDLILADAAMPGINGYELCDAVKKDPALKNVPVLLLAGTFEPFDEQKASQVGADGFINKPFGSDELLRKVDEFFAKVPAARDRAAGLEALGMDGHLWEQEPAPEKAPREPEEVDPWAAISFDEADLGMSAPAVPRTRIPEAPQAPAAPQPPPAAPPSRPAPAPEASFSQPRAAAASPASAPATGRAAEFEAPFTPSPAPTPPEPLVPPVPPRAPQAPAEEPFDSLEFSGFDAQEEVQGPAEEDILELGAEQIVEEVPAETAQEDEFIFENASEAAVDEAAEFEFIEESRADEPALPRMEQVESEETFSALEFSYQGEEGSEMAAAQADLPDDPAFEAPVEAATGPDVITVDEYVDPFARAPSLQVSAEQAFESAPVAEMPEPVAVPDRAAPAAPQVSALSEEDLERVVEKLAGKVIEKLAGTILERIAWEVVPDLAESLIREEIRQIKEKVGA